MDTEDVENTALSVRESGVVCLSDQRWTVARRRAEIIAPLAAQYQVTTVQAIRAGEVLGVGRSTIYKLVDKWRHSGGNVTSLVSSPPSGGRGRKRLSRPAEAVLQTAIENHYLKRQKPSISALMREVRMQCRLNSLPVPAFNTVKSRIDALPFEVTTKKREGDEACRRLRSAAGCTPVPDAPLDVVQIDHTKIDVMVVDEQSRLPIGRPYLSMAIDVYSRAIVGILVTLDPPSATSVGLCLAHCASEKGQWLERLGVDCEWPVYGKPREIHTDNGADFHSEALKRGCDVHGIKIVYRPPGMPHFGGIIERVIGTTMGFVKELPGTTFSNINQKGAYNSEKEAALTLAELEKWLTLAIAGPYHNEVHSGLLESPISKWSTGAVTLPPSNGVKNSTAFLIDFLPVFRRQIQRVGFVIDHVQYYTSALNRWIANRDTLEKFIVRRDPRDISRIWVLDPDAQGYIEVPYRTLSNLPVTAWEQKRAVQQLRENGRDVDEQAIFRAIEQMRVVAQAAVTKKKSARRSVARSNPVSADVPPPTVTLHRKDIEQASEVAAPFFDIEEW